MPFGQAVATGLRKYADFSGRAQRPDFWWFALFVALLWLVAATIAGALVAAATWDELEEQARNPSLNFQNAREFWDWVLSLEFNVPLLVAAAAVMAVFWLIFVLPSLAAMARRLHDMGQSGAWVLLSFVGLGVVPLVMCILESEPRDNRWGPAPPEPQLLPV